MNEVLDYPDYPVNGKRIQKELIELNEAENLYKLYNMETKNILNRIK